MHGGTKTSRDLQVVCAVQGSLHARIAAFETTLVYSEQSPASELRVFTDPGGPAAVLTVEPKRGRFETYSPGILVGGEAA